MESIELFKKSRDAADDVVKAYESNDEKEIEIALCRFMLLMVKFGAIK